MQATEVVKAEKGKIVICPTPLGNLGDMTPRAVEALRAADVVCCEDTRVTGKLLVALGIEGKRLERMDEATIRTLEKRDVSGSGRAAEDGMAGDGGAAESSAVPAGGATRKGDSLVARVARGETIVYCTDAGMPGVSDPGQYLVEAAHAQGVTVEVLPGPVAAVTAYVASGFACPRFYFGGFFPRKAGERKAALETVASLGAVSIFYESPHRLVACLQAVAEALPTRRVAVCRELTKLHEEVRVGMPAGLLAEFRAREEAGGIKGEIVVVIDAPGEAEEAQDALTAQALASEKAQELLAAGTLSKKEIVACLQDIYSISRNAAYEIVHSL